jgi:hypothetical protein
MTAVSAFFTAPQKIGIHLVLLFPQFDKTLIRISEELIFWGEIKICDGLPFFN